MSQPPPKNQPWAVPPGRSSLHTYEPYYGLREKPFSLSPDPRFLYQSRSHAPIFDDLLAGIRRREGLIVLTGDIGTGKTTLCRAVLEKLDRKTFSTFVPDPFVSREGLLKMLLIDFGVMSVDDLKSGRLNGASRPDLSYPLYEFLQSLLPLQAFAVLIIDEAQNLSLPLLEEIRILSDLEAPEKLLQVVLIGQLEFRTRLKLPEMRQVDQRVSVHCELDALSRDGVFSYVAHRLAVAGGAVDRVAFSQEAIDVVYAVSYGVPRVINLVCDRALHHGHLARSACIEADLVRSAVRDLRLGKLPEPALPVPEPALPVPEVVPPVLSPAPPPPDIGMSFDHDDLLNAPLVTMTKPGVLPEERPVETPMPTPPDLNRMLLIESKGSWQTMSAKNAIPWRYVRRRTRGLMTLAAALAIVVSAWAGLAWQGVMEEEAQHTTVPSLPQPPPVRVSSAFVPAPPAEPALLSPEIQTIVPSASADSAAATHNGVYAIDVALFEGSTRASQLVGTLLSQGYRAFQVEVDLGERGRMHEVLVGPYSARASAEADLVRIREMPGFADSRVVPPTHPR